MEQFKEKLEKLFMDIGSSRKMVLSTSYQDKVTSRMMSIIVLDGCFYFQTDRAFRKYDQMKKNPNVALCIDNFQIEGVCRELGHPSENPDFCEEYEKSFKNSYDRYTSHAQERLFVVKPCYIQKWIYEDGEPFVEIFDLGEGSYSKTLYRTSQQK